MSRLQAKKERARNRDRTTPPPKNYERYQANQNDFSELPGATGTINKGLNKKKDSEKSNSEFNIQMGSWDGAESTDIVGLFLLDKLSKIKVSGYSMNVGIYRDDCLLVTKLTPRLTQKLTEKLQELFDEYDLTIVTDANHKKINFLDIYMDLEKGSYSSYILLYKVRCVGVSPSVTFPL